MGWVIVADCGRQGRTEEQMDRELVAMTAVLGLVVLLVVGLLGFVIYAAATDDCVQYAKTGQRYPIVVMVGKIPVTTMYDEMVCVER